VSRVRTIFSHGKFIEVVSADTAPPMREPRSKKDGFALVPLGWMADVTKATGTLDAMLLVLLVYMAWKTKSATFPLSNELLARYGVSRWVKYRTLARLEKAGKLKIQRRGKQALVITLSGGPALI
jgi:hypothetical protein